MSQKYTIDWANGRMSFRPVPGSIKIWLSPDLEPVAVGYIEVAKVDGLIAALLAMKDEATFQYLERKADNGS